jgi:hypothetical protein
VSPSSRGVSIASSRSGIPRPSAIARMPSSSSSLSRVTGVFSTSGTPRSRSRSSPRSIAANEPGVAVARSWLSARAPCRLSSTAIGSSRAISSASASVTSAPFVRMRSAKARSRTPRAIVRNSGWLSGSPPVRAT